MCSKGGQAGEMKMGLLPKKGWHRVKMGHFCLKGVAQSEDRPFLPKKGWHRVKMGHFCLKKVAQSEDGPFFPNKGLTKGGPE